MAMVLEDITFDKSTTESFNKVFIIITYNYLTNLKLTLL